MISNFHVAHLMFSCHVQLCSAPEICARVQLGMTNATALSDIEVGAVLEGGVPSTQHA